MRAFFLDVDGVVTDRYARVDADVTREICRLAERQPVFLITGRSTAWFDENVKPCLLKSLGPKARVVFFGENGYERVEVGGGRESVTSRGPRMPRAVQDAVREAARPLDAFRLDASKKHMVSVEADHDAARKDPEKVARQLNELERLMKRVGRRFGLVVVRSTYAVDLVHPGISKASAVEKALEWLGGTPKSAVVIGDSPSDLRMLEPLAGVRARFFFVGERESFGRLRPAEKRKVTAKFIGEYARGALKVLKTY